MDDKNNSPVIKLLGNKLFITLLVFAVVIILFSAFWNGRVAKIANTEEVQKKVEDIPVNSDIKEEVVVTPELEETFLPVDEAQEPVAELTYSMPLNGELQKEYSEDELLWDDTMQDWRTHCGIDIASAEGDEVDTSAAGTVTEVKTDEMYGYVVKVDHGNGITTVYKNLAKTVVSEGDILDEGQMIGTVGNSGAFEQAQKPHLHFEVISDGEYLDPLEFIPQQ